MTKYRIIQDGKQFIPQQRILFMWFAFTDYSTDPDYYQHMFFKSLPEAEVWLVKKCAEKEQKVMVMREYTVEKMHDELKVHEAINS